MRKQLEQMGTDLRELMVYQCPSELGALYTEVQEMMLKIGSNVTEDNTKNNEKEKPMKKVKTA